MARCLIIACGCRGRSLGLELIARGHAVRGTTRDRAQVAAIEAIGAEAFVGDPDVIGSLAGALEHVTVAVILLGSAAGAAAQLAALHGTRLDMLLTRMIDTTVRGVVYEAAGTVNPELLEAGAMRVRAQCEDSRIPYAVLRAKADRQPAWTIAAAAAVQHVLDGGPASPR